MKAFNLTGIDPEVGREFKAACAHYGISMRGTLINYIQNIVADYKADKSRALDKELIKSKVAKKK
ncbi:hypothetical protein ES702_06770 [subsurface metagenome]